MIFSSVLPLVINKTKINLMDYEICLMSQQSLFLGNDRVVNHSKKQFLIYLNIFFYFIFLLHFLYFFLIFSSDLHLHLGNDNKDTEDVLSYEHGG